MRIGGLFQRKGAALAAALPRGEGGLRTAARFRVAAVVPEDEVSGGLVVE